MLNTEFRKLFRERALRFLCLAMLCALGVTSYLYAAGEKTAVTQAQYDAKMRGIMQTAQRNYEKQAANTTNPYLLSYNGQILDVYGSMPQVTVTEGEVYTPEEWMTSQIPDLYCCALLALLVPVLFLSETNHRTAPVLLATVGGRRRLARMKILLLLFLTFGTVLAADAVSLCGTVLHCGMPDFSVSVQTMPAFVLCPLVMPAWAAVLIRIALRTVFFCFAALLFALCACAVQSNLLSVLCSGAIVGVTCLVGAIPPFDGNDPIRLCCGTTLVHGTECIAQYHGIQVGNASVPYPVLLLVIAAIFGVLLPILLRVTFYRRSVKGSRVDRAVLALLGKLKLKRRRGRRTPRRVPSTAFGWEIYKTAVKRGGILILIGALALHGFLLMKKGSLSNGFDGFWYEYMTAVEGTRSEEKSDWLTREIEEVRGKQVSTEVIFEKFQKREITEEEMDDMMYEARNAEYRIAALQRVRQHAAYLDDVARTEGVEAEYVYDTGYEALFAEEYNWIIPAAAALLFAGLFASERESGFSVLLCCLPEGGGKNRRQKYLLAVLGGVCLAVLDSIVVLCVTAYRYELPRFGAPAVSLETFGKLHTAVPIRVFYLYLVLIRCVFTALCCLVAAFCSSHCRTTLTALFVSGIVLFVPHLLAQYEPLFTYLDPGLYANGTSLLRALYAVPPEPEFELLLFGAGNGIIRS